MPLIPVTYIFISYHFWDFSVK